MIKYFLFTQHQGHFCLRAWHEYYRITVLALLNMSDWASDVYKNCRNIHEYFLSFAVGPLQNSTCRSSHRACFTPSHAELENHSASLMHVLLTVFLFFCLHTTIQSMCLHVIKYRVYVCISIFKVFGWVPQLFKQRLTICSLYFWDLHLYPSGLLFWIKHTSKVTSEWCHTNASILNVVS